MKAKRFYHFVIHRFVF